MHGVVSDDFCQVIIKRLLLYRIKEKLLLAQAGRRKGGGVFHRNNNWEVQADDTK